MSGEQFFHPFPTAHCPLRTAHSPPMAISTKTIKRRIKSIASTKKITKAMELVEGTKMRKSVALAMMSREYAKSITDLVQDVRALVDPTSHPLLAGRPQSTSTLVLVAASDRGLCGGYNSQVVKKALEFLRGRTESLRLITAGRRADQAVKRAGYEILASFEAMSNAPSFERTRPLGKFMYDEFMSGRADRVFIVYMDFKSAVVQVPIVKQLLPIIPEQELKENMNNVGAPLAGAQPPETEAEEEGWYKNKQDQEANDQSEILFEPDPKTVLNSLLPRLLETQVYQSLLESSASEHSARMMAMRNATDNASDMLQDLSFTYNQARQATITREISEISAGKAAIE